ncbi:MAG: penicillin-binding transpeptidase domain-containing protein [Pseudomonadota bacterium]
MKKAKRDNPNSFRLRLLFAFGVLGLAAVGLAGRAVDLQLVDHGFLAGQGDARFSRVTATAAHRGTILDRNGEPLAVSTPVDSVWANPKELNTAIDQWPTLAKALKANRQSFTRRITSSLDRDFLYLARHMAPADALAVRKLGVPGVNLVREYRRYYPSGEVVGHVLGFTNVDDEGQEGTELAYDHWLAGEDGSKRVIQDRLGRKVQDVESIRTARPGRDLTLSIDLRLQYLAYRELKAAMREQHARAGSVVVLDVRSGEVLAMVNQPAFNPNDREQLTAATYRNRAATDILEPGSSIKPFIMAAALQSGRYDGNSVVDTGAGFIRVGAKTIEDEHPLGAIGLSTILAKSSNVGMTKIALSLEPQEIWSTLTHLGFGQVTSSGFPGESAGLLSHYANWRPPAVASMSYGYGMAVTPLQLAHAYATIGALGIARPVTMLRVDEPIAGERVLSERNSRTLIKLLEAVVSPDGTGKLASIPGYRVAGKTGTAWKANGGSYSTDRYFAVFGGVAPASNPRLAAVVVIDDPGGTRHHGGDVAAPVFASVVGGALRFLAVAPDDATGAKDDPLTITQTVVRR